MSEAIVEALWGSRWEGKKKSWESRELGEEEAMGAKAE